MHPPLGPCFGLDDGGLGTRAFFEARVDLGILQDIDAGAFCGVFVL